MKMSIIVLDDFYDNPHDVREAALSYPYQEREQVNNWPGVNSLKQYLVEDLEETISSIVHEPLTASPRTAHCGFRLAMEGATARTTRSGST